MMREYLRSQVLAHVAYRPGMPREKPPHVDLWTSDGASLLSLVLPLQKGEDPAPLLARLEDRLSFSWGDLMGELTAQTLREARQEQAQREVRFLTPALLATYVRMTGRADIHGGWPRRIREMPLSHIRGYAREYLRVERAAFLHLVPSSEATGTARAAP